jgi:hypothetical protein
LYNNSCFFLTEDWRHSEESVVEIMARLMAGCFSSLADCLYGGGEWTPSKGMAVAPAVPDVTLDTTAMGKY